MSLMRSTITLVLLITALTSLAGQAPSGGAFNLPITLSYWMANPSDFDGDGSQEIVLTTMDPNKNGALTSPTPVYILGANNGMVTDRSRELFQGSSPKTYSSKPFTGDFDGDGAMDLLICDRGRTAGPMPTWYWAPTEGAWAAQNQVFLQRGGALVDFTSAYPQYFNQNWGCSAGDVDKSGRDTIVINSFFAVAGWTNAHLLRWDGSRFVKTLDLVRGAPSASGWGWSATADFNKDGYADVVGSGKVLWGGGSGLTNLKTLEPSQVEKAGYTFFRGTLTSDLTGDGYPDLVKISSAPEPNYQGARLALYASDGKGGLVEKLDAFPALDGYRNSDFGDDMTIVDINFDGHPDLVPFGITRSTYYPDRPGELQAPTAVWLNDGTGRFSFARWSDPRQPAQTCQTAGAYFLKTSDPAAFNLVTACGRQYVGRQVTPLAPLTLR